MLLEKKYKELVSEYGFESETAAETVNAMLRDVLAMFIASCKNPAIWCYGEHTKMLMSEFMNELKTVKYIIDGNAQEYMGESGFKVICGRDAELCGIDGIIISSFKYRNEIKAQIRAEHPSIKYLDIYEYFESNGIFLRKEYYLSTHPYSKYATINRLKCLIRTEKDGKQKEQLLFALLGSFVEIKDFFLAVKCAKALCALNNSGRNNKLLKQLVEIYDMECAAAEQINADNILMLCIDGLRDKDVADENMSALCAYIRRHCRRYTNAYSVSTSTYESLVPAFGENPDMRTRYYEKNYVPQEKCRFIQKAGEQGRNIYFYTDLAKYVDADQIIRKEAYETVTEKLWDFILDASGERNALFYVHVLYESHYSYPNPYIDDEMIAEGTNILFDYLHKNGGRIRTDYESQHRHTLRYLDDILTPVLERIKCRMLLFADHGNIILDQNAKTADLTLPQLTYHNDLIHIPFIIKAPEMPVGVDDKRISLMEINEILVCLMEKKKFAAKQPSIVKIQRSAVYNPDFQYLYRKCGLEQGLKAFEAFVFEDQSKLVVYEDGYVELAENDVVVENDRKKKELLAKVRGRITVCVE